MTPRVFRVVALSVVLGGTALLLSGCSWSEALGLGWPEGITPEAHLNRELWIGSVIASLVVGVIVWGLIFWTLGVSPAQEDATRSCRASSATTCRWSWCSPWCRS